ncbi:VWA domain-containing protein [Thalassotalea euphylliae]|uniref:VWA domain-containing protein n=1 Tax=Thalassotalea euphylliae TaxID=1655234 RepID=A0A3E0TNN0_9GAMM|nr:VWA domain-containing protein [Thalassotalea euphylliae]REL25880.1 VWA domain-containing protein [Thalassotalea euphylliae]
MLKKIAVIFILFIAMVSSSQAALIRTALGIAIDESGSIGSTNFATQTAAYAAVLGDPSIVPADGSVVINVFTFSSGTELVQTAIRLNDEADRTTLINSINAMTFSGGGTNIDAGVSAVQTDMDAYLATIDMGEFDTNFRKLIDVSTDGEGFAGSGNAATNQALADGYTEVNCLGIGSSADCSWNEAGLDFAASTFAELEAALRIKIATEINNPATIPTPNSILLLGLSLFCLRLLGGRKV